MNFQQAKFFITVNDWQGLPPDNIVEVAFAGRSNAGKSSAINCLTQQRKLAFTSKTPGRTQHINYFSLGDDCFLVDLPGYGYAEVPLSVKLHWQKLLSQYLTYRDSLRALVVLMDIRHPLTPLDRQLLEWFEPTGKPLLILLTKADKLGRGGQTKVLQEVKEELKSLKLPYHVIPFSSHNRQGFDEVTELLHSFFKKDNEGNNLEKEG
ncbi:MAG: YihA family ribosome biogenesis GTP-binding protein [Ferrovum sp. 37-45-19]|uniref:ribosome biogenesis GTP-binding protein YihA/YsxC n=1 Tax=Ferrovum sp. JA12 TaxID=1356299 RepID=UPI000703085F|nr:ribosome biogenesis GTP-binding protein YihA/YsxC [Ferrovum sp. JA12]OYV79361.1 MAG: YihA family ribosome biogenesis GTP-binding protein [Ferrovum sp. 21-44-67]OYV94000.1 MAG: YihA family ribosome biogenesis GTP-binding protein [Ferrovum sp. 37-45-19]OZB34463.1 MAG: YihA family ribosome biogenesis GTP-binding protein [Ferrovum sp. 34-44-207]HQT81834.1 ribosome biogenesis GTP-binding protein YihA/YsxC [Ferrovaceae bacterium]KRH79365.1 putative GTP-binding protein EngB [Ferrovum sp. JA12]